MNNRWPASVLRPARYHGERAAPPFFEGWYFKLVSAAQDRRLAVIPGVFLSDDPAQAHAFVQVFDGLAGHASYHQYPVTDFVADPRRFEVRIGPNRFSREAITLAIDDATRRVAGTVRLGPGPGWPVTLASPGVMGPFAWLPFLECYHGVLSFDHALAGALTVDGADFAFDGGRGYLEKDWGQAFPTAWIWMQSNHFDEPDVCLTASTAVIPLPLGVTFPGFIVGLWHRGRLHRFTTYNLARTERLAVDAERVTWVLRNRTHRLALRATRAGHGSLPGPSRAAMDRRVLETLRATIDVRLTTIARGRRGRDDDDGADERVVFEGAGRCGGLEVIGDTRPLERG